MALLAICEPISNMFMIQPYEGLTAYVYEGIFGYRT